MRVHAFVDEGLGHSSYVLDLGDGTAAVVDPPRFPADHERLADTHGLRLAWTLDTHSHADYVTGSPALADRGSVFIAPAASNLATAHRAVIDGQHVALATGVRLTALATPGHTPDHHAYLVGSEGRPVALFTGGSLMVGAVGRTDLCGPELAEPLAHEMFRSLRRFDDLPDDLAVYPTHGAGSFCSAPGATERTTTLGRERATNRLFAIRDETAFVEELLEGFGTFPTYFSRLPELNRLGPRRYDTIPFLPKLGVVEVDRHLETGGIVIDVRPIARFAAGHLPGSVSNALRPVFASWLGWLIDPSRPVVFVLDAHQDRGELVRQCLDVGHERITGELDGGIDAWTGSGRGIATIPLTAPDEIEGTVVDVRQANEYIGGHLPGAWNVELGSIATAVLSDAMVTLMCGHGERAMTAASLLTRRGHRHVRVLDGGPETWAAATGQPLLAGQ